MVGLESLGMKRLETGPYVQGIGPMELQNIMVYKAFIFSYTVPVIQKELPGVAASTLRLFVSVLWVV